MFANFKIKCDKIYKWDYSELIHDIPIIVNSIHYPKIMFILTIE